VYYEDFFLLLHPMKRLLLTILWFLMGITAIAQSSSDYLVAREIPAKTLFYEYNGAGTLMPRIHWGLDVAWISENNVQQGRNYMNMFGTKNVDIMRVSFQPSYALNGSSLADDAINILRERLAAVDKLGTAVDIYLNSDPSKDGENVVDNSYIYNFLGKRCNVDNWVKLMKYTGQYIENYNSNYRVVSAAPFNEPDYGWGQGTEEHLNSICKAAKSDSWFDGKRLMTGNTLNTDYAWSWFNSCKSYSDEANTHQLAGSMSNFISFMQQAKSAGATLCLDEMHNVFEAMVGANYGLDNGIWWGTAEHARSQFCRANDGTGYRLAYQENGDAYMAASVYRNTQDGLTEAFVGCSERQAVETSFGFVSKDRDVYYNGEGPTRAFYQHMAADPEGAYQTEKQRNAETVIDIQSGADVQPFKIEGDYQILSVSTGKVITGNNAYTEWGANTATLADGTGADNQGWRIEMVPEDQGGDFSYYTIAQNNLQWWTYYLDDLDWSFNEAQDVIMYPGGGSGCEQWYFRYAGDGDYYIFNRFSNLCLDASEGSKVVQRTCTKSPSQRWKLVGATLTPNRTVPATPTGLSATALPASVKLTWNANSETDLMGYTILRTEKGSEDWNTIARNVTGTTYVDNTAEQGVTYTYRIKAVNTSSYISALSGTAEAAPTAQRGLIARWEFEGSTADETVNKMDAALLTDSFTVSSKSGEQALCLDGSSNYALLPYQIANMESMTFSAWVYWKGGNSWQRVFDFGNGEDEYMFLSPSNGSGMRYEVKCNGTTEGITLNSTLSSNTWVHVAVTVESGKTCIYLNGELAGSSTSLTILPTDINSVCNYLGRSQFVADPLFNGNLDDVRIYNYALSQTAIKDYLGLVKIGDVNLDGLVDVNDVTALVDIILGSWGSQAHGETDINEDGKTDVNDVTRLVDIILGVAF